MKIRPHHLLCIGNFVGKGYSEEFTGNMKHVIYMLNNGERLVLADGSDDICKACPFNTNGICKDEEKVLRYDKAVKTALSIEYGAEYSYNDIFKIVKEEIYNKNMLKEICGDCEWAELCNSVIISNKS